MGPLDEIELTELDKDAIALTLLAIGRTGAQNCTLGYEEEDETSWFAEAVYGEGEHERLVRCHAQSDPVAAVIGLYLMLAAGGICTTCEKAIAFEGDGVIDGARMNGDQFETHNADPEIEYCHRTFVRSGWTGCARV